MAHGQSLCRHLDPLLWGQRTKLPGLQTVSGARLLTASLRSRSPGNSDHDRLESVITMLWNAHQRERVGGGRNTEGICQHQKHQCSLEEVDHLATEH